MDELLGLALIIYIVASALLGMLRREQARTRPRHPEEAEGDGQPGPWRDWEEELRDLFERTRERQQAEGAAEEPEPAPAEADDDRPWLEIEPIPLPDQWPMEEVPRWPRSEEPGSGEPGGEEHAPGTEGPPLPAPVPPVPSGPTAPWPPGRDPVGAGDGAARVASPERGGLARRVRRRLRGDRDQLREAVILMEVLGPPRALRPYRPPWMGR